MRPHKLYKIFFGLIIIGMSLMIIPNAKAARDQATKPSEDSLTKPVASPDFNIWFYTKPVDGVSQVFMQYFDPSTTTQITDTITEVQLTFSETEKSNVIPGPIIAKYDLTYFDYAEGTDTAPGKVCPSGTGLLYYYLADGHITMGCIKGMTTDGSVSFPSPGFTDVQLTGFDESSTFEGIEDMDSSKYRQYSFGMNIPGYGLVFTASGKLHFLIHDSITLYKGVSNVSNGLIIYDLNNTISTDVYIWDPSAQTHSYKQPNWDRDGELITVATLNNDFWQVSTLEFTGDHENQITDLSRNVSHPQFPAGSDGYIFFEMDEDATNKANLAFVSLDVQQNGTDFNNEVLGWCTDYFAFEDPDNIHSRKNFNFKYESDENFLLLYEYTNLDNKNDAYVDKTGVLFGREDLCTATSTTPINSKIVYANPTETEYPITCENHNQYPMWQSKLYNDPNLYHNEDYLLVASDLRDVILLREWSDGSGLDLDLISDTENINDTCVPNCYEELNGEPIVDNNGYLDGDGIKDECEQVPPPPPPPPEETEKWRIRGGIAQFFTCSFHANVIHGSNQALFLLLVLVPVMLIRLRKKK